METGELERYGRRITGILFTTQCLFSAGNIMLFTVGSILAVRMGGGKIWTGVPMTLLLVGAALGAWPMGRFMDRFGRRRGFAVGQLCGLTGSLIAGTAVVYGTIVYFLIGLLLIGLARGALDMGRYAAADVNPSHRRARAISLVVLGGTTGALVGPPLLQLISRLEMEHGLPAMSGPWYVMALFLILCFLLAFGFLRPDPLDIARLLASREGDREEAPVNVRRLAEIVRDSRFVPAVGSMICGHLVMYLVMTVTPVFMHECRHGIAEISWVIFAHMFGMYGLSFFVGWLIDRIGRTRMIAVGSMLLAVACLSAPMYNGTAWLALILFLVGLGWNCCFVSGSTLLSDILRPQERGRTQGLVDTLVNSAAGTGSLGSGLLFAYVGFSVMIWISLCVALVPILLVRSVSIKGPDHRLISYPDGME